MVANHITVTKYSYYPQMSLRLNLSEMSPLL